MPDGSSLLPDVLQAREPSLQLPAAEEPSAEELQMAREVIQAARLWANIKKIRHQKIKWVHQ